MSVIIKLRPNLNDTNHNLEIFRALAKQKWMYWNTLFSSFEREERFTLKEFNQDSEQNEAETIEYLMKFERF